jgi:ribA/ribD-fused uncharacterized protein
MGENQTSMKPITFFRGPYRFLSNFYPSKIWYEGMDWITAEHAYQAAKTILSEEKQTFRDLSLPSEAKKFGRKITIREDWNDVKLRVMSDIVLAKFDQNPELLEMLLATEDALLIEGNYWGDTFWGQCPVGTGFNNLGLILMDTRKLLSGRSQS